MKNTLRVLSAVLVIASASIAQAQGGGGGNNAERQAQMRAAQFEGITLTDTQKASLDSLDQAFQPKMVALRAEPGARAQGSPATPEWQEKNRALQAERLKAIKTILTPEQAAQYDKNAEAMRARRGGDR